jgi:hypothetical protein
VDRNWSGASEPLTMTSRYPSLLLSATLLCTIASDLAVAQEHASMTETKPALYTPGLGELMTAFVQPRHIKLGLAGNQHNWPYAAYELDELAEAFDDVAGLVPKHDNMSIPEMLASTVKQPMAALDAAIKAQNSAAFSKAYTALTGSCNACHRSAGHPMIVIQIPIVSAFPDQDFRPKQK